MALSFVDAGASRRYIDTLGTGTDDDPYVLIAGRRLAVYEVDITTDGAGVGSGDSTEFSGRVLAISYVKNNFTDGVDFTITLKNTGESVWVQNDVNASVTKHPMAQATSTAGVGLTYDGTEPIIMPILAVDDQVHVAVASGGATHTGTFYITVALA